MSLGTGCGYQVFANVIKMVARPRALSEEPRAACPSCTGGTAQGAAAQTATTKTPNPARAGCSLLAIAGGVSHPSPAASARPGPISPLLHEEALLLL